MIFIRRELGVITWVMGRIQAYLPGDGFVMLYSSYTNSLVISTLGHSPPVANSVPTAVCLTFPFHGVFNPLHPLEFADEEIMLFFE